MTEVQCWCLLDWAFPLLRALLALISTSVIWSMSSMHAQLVPRYTLMLSALFGLSAALLLCCVYVNKLSRGLLAALYAVSLLSCIALVPCYVTAYFALSRNDRFFIQAFTTQPDEWREEQNNLRCCGWTDLTNATLATGKACTADVRPHLCRALFLAAYARISQAVFACLVTGAAYDLLIAISMCCFLWNEDSPINSHALLN
jgi:hypothetical protein